MAVRTRTIRIGNSLGIRIPKLLLVQSGLNGEVELVVEHNKIIIHAADSPRRDWEEAFATMTQHGDDALLDPDVIEVEWDQEEWQW